MKLSDQPAKRVITVTKNRDGGTNKDKWKWVAAYNGLHGRSDFFKWLAVWRLKREVKEKEPREDVQTTKKLEVKW